MYTLELYCTFSNQTNQKRCHVTNRLLDGTERLQENSSQLKTKIMMKDHLMASTKNLSPLCQNSAEDINLGIPTP